MGHSHVRPFSHDSGIVLPRSCFRRVAAEFQDRLRMDQMRWLGPGKDRKPRWPKKLASKSRSKIDICNPTSQAAATRTETVSCEPISLLELPLLTERFPELQRAAAQSKLILPVASIVRQWR